MPATPKKEPLNLSGSDRIDFAQAYDEFLRRHNPERDGLESGFFDNARSQETGRVPDAVFEEPESDES